MVVSGVMGHVYRVTLRYASIGDVGRRYITAKISPFKT